MALNLTKKPDQASSKSLEEKRALRRRVSTGAQGRRSSNEGSVSVSSSDDYSCSEAVDAVRCLPRSDSWGELRLDDERPIPPCGKEDKEYKSKCKAIDAIRSRPRRDSWGNLNLNGIPGTPLDELWSPCR